MNQNSNESAISSEIDAIIARAMAEYSNARGIDAFAPIEPSTPIEEEQPVQEEVPEENNIPDAIPENSGSILVEESTSRFSSAIWFDNIQTKSVVLAGLGGIGSYVSFLLARLRPNYLILYDDDIVEAANMSGQLYGSSNIGQRKVDASLLIANNFANNYNITAIRERYTEDSEASDIMICGFDNMEARRIFYAAWKAHVLAHAEEDRKKCLFIDGRLAAEQFQVLCITGDDAFNMNKYEQEFIFSDEEAEETICSYKQTTFMANMIGSVMVNLFVNFCANECEPLIPRDLPFFTEYSAETMYFKVIA